MATIIKTKDVNFKSIDINLTAEESIKLYNRIKKYLVRVIKIIYGSTTIKRPFILYDGTKSFEHNLIYNILKSTSNRSYRFNCYSMISAFYGELNWVKVKPYFKLMKKLIREFNKRKDIHIEIRGYRVYILYKSKMINEYISYGQQEYEYLTEDIVDEVVNRIKLTILSK